MKELTKRIPIFNTKTALEDVPREWLRIIEPHVMRGRFLPCWQWVGGVTSNGYPRLRWTDPDGIMHDKTVRRMIARIFWENSDYYHIRMTCENMQCVNPNHIALSGHHTNAYKR